MDAQSEAPEQQKTPSADVPPTLSGPAAGRTDPADFAQPHDITAQGSTTAAPADGPAAPARGEESLSGYELLREVARGGMGIVYEAWDKALERTVALKRMRADALGGAGNVQRFDREVRAAARLTHPHVVPVYGVGHDGDVPFYTMALVPGGSLADHRARFQADPRAAVALIEKVARAVHYAHGQGILHRDLKPGNILLDERGEPQVGDFGLAKFQDDVELTHTGAVLGTPAYMAPEQAEGRGQDVGPPTDVWALGVVLYELLAGCRPFKGETGQDIRSRIVSEDPPRPRSLRPGLDRDLENIVLKCLEKTPGRRYPSAQELADELGRWLRGEPVQARRAGLLRRGRRFARRHPLLCTLAALLLLSALVTPVVLWQTRPDQPIHEVREQLHRGESVTLIGDTGPPRWKRWAVGETGFAENYRGGKEFYLQSIDPVLLELLPGPLPTRYRVRAQFRDESNEGGTAGLVFAYDHWPTPAGEEHLFCAVTFAETRPVRGNVSAMLWRWRMSGPVMKFRQGTTLLKKDFDGVRIDEQRLWRTVEVQASPEEYRFRWEGEEIGVVTRADLLSAARPLVLRNPLPEDQSGATFVEPAEAFRPEGGVGLILEKAGVACRRFVVEP